MALPGFASEREQYLVEVMYELLDAHDDTTRLAADQRDIRWQAHLDYLRDLQRVGREALSHATATCLSSSPNRH